MSVAYWLTPLVLIALVLYLLQLRRLRLSHTQPLDGPYHCVSVVPGRNACKAVRILKRERYFPDEAPPLLPVPGCTAESCQCHYKHHTDRRYRARRAAKAKTPEQLSIESDRRTSPGRRGCDRTPRPKGMEPVADAQSGGQAPQ